MIRILFLKFISIFKIRKDSWLLRVFKIPKIHTVNLWMWPQYREMSVYKSLALGCVNEASFRHVVCHVKHQTINRSLLHLRLHQLHSISQTSMMDLLTVGPTLTRPACRAAAAAAAIHQYLLPRLSSKPASSRCCCRWDIQMDGRSIVSTDPVPHTIRRETVDKCDMGRWFFRHCYLDDVRTLWELIAVRK